jgi:hypothetical protein
LAVVGTLGWVLSQVGFAAKLEPPPIALQQPAAPVVAVADQAAPTSAPVAMPVGQYPQCQNLQTVEQIAQTIGGPAADWSPPDWVSSTTQGAFTFRSRYVNHLTYPGFGFFDTPAGRFVQGDVDASEASFHCEEPPTS